MIFDIQKFCISDGPGIRTTVFIKGCPLNCVWCHNPESKAFNRELSYQPNKCRHCGICASLCNKNCQVFIDGVHTFNRNDCIVCGKCLNINCNALKMIGIDAPIKDIISEIKKDAAFYAASGGGLTISGGEPMSDFSFVFELVKSAKKENIHICMETCGYAKKEDYLKIQPYIDIFLFDYKETNAQFHKQYTGVGNKTIIENLIALDNVGASIILRCPIIPGYNDRKDHFEGIAEMASGLENIIEINIMPYHSLGEQKSNDIGKTCFLHGVGVIDNSVIDTWVKAISRKTSVPVLKSN